MARTCMLDLSFSSHLALGLWLWWFLKMSKRTKPYNCICPKIYFHEDWSNHVPAISQLCPYHKSQLVRLCSQSASLPVCLCKASERNLRIKRSRVLTSEATARQSPVKGFEITTPGGGLEEKRKSFNFKNIESQKGRQNIPFLLFSWRRSGSSWSQTK